MKAAVPSRKGAQDSVSQKHCVHPGGGPETLQALLAPRGSRATGQVKAALAELDPDITAHVVTKLKYSVVTSISLV
ncbi:hypothetical protein NDU88_010459 [Pleurodeles waltl]|uniref:Uncharacterized protein n=1 Tax=Pleurodeles waltl TaxID=8319 RepID=A0AAV7S2Q3_PLEWA|nr:hypothetical protein NDU88_010459 [Pleurodeles waltl]